MPDKTNDTVFATVIEQLMAEGPLDMAQIITALMNLAMRMEREQFLGAGHYERAVERRGYANGTKSELIDTPAGTAEPGCAQNCRNGRAVLSPGTGTGVPLEPRGHAGGGPDGCVRRLDPRACAGAGRVRLESLSSTPSNGDPSQPGRQAAR